MPRISLWKPNKGKDYEFSDKAGREVLQIGGVGVILHKYLGVGDNEDVTEIEDSLFLENRDRNYSSDLIELRGKYSPVDTDYDLSQFGIFLSSDVLRFDFHYNDMIGMVGRKIISGDVFEIPAERDTDIEGNFVNSYYVVQDSMYSSSGRGTTWRPHFWKVRAKKLTASPEFADIIDSAARQETLGGEGNLTGFTYKGIADFLGDELYNDTVKDAIDKYSAYLGITKEIVREAEQNVYFDPKFFVGKHLYIYMDNDTPMPFWWKGTGEPPNGAPLRGIGTSFPDDMQDGEYFLRVDYTPDRLFQRVGNRYIRIEDDVRKLWTAYNRRLDTYIDNDNLTIFNDGEIIPERTSLHDVLRDREGLNEDKKDQMECEQERQAFISKKIDDLGNDDV